ncbi:MAG: hypothetical protein ACXVPU_15965 [Bacteroidia bacterium]
MKKFFTILLLTVTMTGAFAQKAKQAPMYSFGGKTSDFSITWDEYSKAKKELTPVDKSITIKSFTVSILMTSAGGTAYVDHVNNGSTFTSETISEIEKMRNNPAFASTLYFSSVIATKDGKEVKAPEMTIKIK